MLTDAAQEVARQQLQRSSPQCFLLPLATEHKQLLLLLLTEGLAVAYLKTEKVGTKTGVLEVDLVLIADLLTTSRNSCCFSTSTYSVGLGMAWNGGFSTDPPFLKSHNSDGLMGSQRIKEQSGTHRKDWKVFFLISK